MILAIAQIVSAVLSLAGIIVAARAHSQAKAALKAASASQQQNEKTADGDEPTGGGDQRAPSRARNRQPE